MGNNKVNVDDTTVVIKAESAAEARELAAAAEAQVLTKDATLADWFDRKLDQAGEFVDVLGRPAFGTIAWGLAIIGSFIAFISWTRLLPVKDLDWLLGIVGILIVVSAKLASGRWAVAVNVGDKIQTNTWSAVALVCLFINFVAAFAFQAAVTVDQQTGVQDVKIKISDLRREARDLKYSAEDMNAPQDPLDVLQFDLNRALNRTAKNNQGQPTDLTVATVIAWGTDDYCMPGGRYSSYVDRYCEDIAELHRAVIVKDEHDNKLALAELKMAEADELQDNRPRQSSASALGSSLGDGWRANVFGALLMLIIESAMVASAYVAKRHPKNIMVKTPEKSEGGE